MKKILEYLLIAGITIFIVPPVLAQAVLTDTLILSATLYGTEAITDSNQTVYYYYGNPFMGREKPYYIYDDESYAVYRAYFVFDLSPFDNIPELELTTVKVHYNTGGGLYEFKITKPSGITQSNAQNDWTNIGNGSTLESDLDYGQWSRTSTAIKGALENALSSGELILGVLSENETANDSKAGVGNLWMEVIYEWEPVSISAIVRNDYHGFDGGTIGIGVDGNPVSFSSPKSFAGYETQTLSLAAYDNQIINTTPTVFNNTEAPENKSEWRWQKEQDTEIFGQNDQTPTWELTSDDDGATFAAILKGKYNITRNDYSSELGGNINSANVTVIEGNTLSAPASHTDNGIKYTFYQWSDGETDRARIISTPASPLTAHYKAVGHSNDSKAFASNSQRRMVQTTSGSMPGHEYWLHRVYTSMGHVWMEHSGDDGTIL